MSASPSVPEALRALCARLRGGVECAPWVIEALQVLLVPCDWYEDDSGDYWVPGCDTDHSRLWVFGDGGPVENQVGCCPYCGRPVQVVPTPHPGWLDDDEEDEPDA